jgi:pre-mRNA-splicing helicase BRR2
VGGETQSGEEADIENNLVLLLDMDKFALVKLLLKNRLKIVWCTRLARAQNEEEVARLEAEMEANADTVKILKELHATRASARERQNAMERRCVGGAFASGV